MKRIRVYEIYPRKGGGFSTQTNDYHGVLIRVSATSINQAYAKAHANQWATSGSYPVGILGWYSRGHGYKMWKDQPYDEHYRVAELPRNEQGVTVIRDFLEAVER